MRLLMVKRTWNEVGSDTPSWHIQTVWTQLEKRCDAEQSSHISASILHGFDPFTLQFSSFQSWSFLQERLRIFHNRLSGEIPKELGSLPQLVELQVQSNQLSGRTGTDLGLTWTDREMCITVHPKSQESNEMI